MVQDTFCTLPSAKDIKSKGTVIERHVAKCLSLFLFHLKLLFLLRLNKVAIKKEYVKMTMKKFTRAKHRIF